MCANLNQSHTHNLHLSLLPGRTTGRALLFDRWTLTDGRIGAPLVPALLPSEVPGDADVQRADEAVRRQADEVRRLKLQQRLGNQVRSPLMGSHLGQGAGGS